MCEVKEAVRFMKLAHEQLNDKEFGKAKKSYLEAASIYVLQSGLQHDDTLLKKANAAYRSAHSMSGEDITTVFTIQELAKRTLHELHDNHHHDELEELSS